MRKRQLAVLMSLVAATAFLLAPGSAEAGKKKKKGIKGRYLQLETGVDLTAYKDAVLVLEPAEITADKDRAVDTESVRSTSDQMLKDALEATRLFHSVVSEVPLEIPEDRPILRLKPKLSLQYGSQAMRFFVGAGAGKSKLHIRIDFVDAKTGASLGFFNGYGTGAGFGSVSGGGVQRMARDDFQENYGKLSELLLERMP